MTPYKNWAPTQFDTRGLGLEEQQNWLVLAVSRTRDSGALDQSNFASALERLRATAKDRETVETHTFGHWRPGWIEVILIDASDLELVKEAESIESALEDYPVLDETDYSNREHEEYLDSWRNGECSDFTRGLVKAFGLRDATEEKLEDASYDVMREFYESLIPSGDYYEENRSRVPYAIRNCTRERIAEFLRTLRATARITA